MTFLDKLSQAAGHLKCYSGFHTDMWVYISGSSCEQELNCNRCGHQKRIKHKVFSRWTYEKEGLCVQSRECNRCAHTDFRTRHHFDYKAPSGPMNCRSFRKVCGRCGHEEEEYHASPQHEWSRWQLGHRVGQRYRYCKNCGRREFEDLKGL